MKIKEQPFWEDGTEYSTPPLQKGFSRIVSYYSIIVRLIILIVFAPALFAVSPMIMLIWVAILGLSIGVRIYFLFAINHTTRDIVDIQQLARERTGASHIGSAIHVAGHPLLQRDQPVVLALIRDQLSIYSYENSNPLDIIPLQNIQTIQTITYDDDRIPHADVIDSAAQAVQLNFLWQEQTCTCLFHRMKKMRPIDWYQALQQARLHAGYLRP
jgi:hypothetical protein